MTLTQPTILRCQQNIALEDRHSLPIEGDLVVTFGAFYFSRTWTYRRALIKPSWLTILMGTGFFKFYGLAALAWGVIVIRTTDPVMARPSI